MQKLNKIDILYPNKRDFNRAKWFILLDLTSGCW